jgi:adenylate kinase
MRVIVTGVPGTGKTTIAGLLAKRLKCRLVKVNELLEEKGLWRGEDEFGSKIARLKPLREAVAELIGEEARKGRSVVVEGHLACELKLPADFVVVCRTDPVALARRLEKRGYPEKKSKENVLAEMLDYCLIRSECNYGKAAVFQVNTTRAKPEESVKRVLRVLGGGRKPRGADWSGKLEEML